jgi:hypothetical protein
MPALVVSGAALVTLRWTQFGIPMVNVLGASVGPTTTINQALSDTLSTAIKSSFTSVLGARINAGTALVSVGIRDIRSANLAEFIGAGAQVVGANPGEPLPKQTTFCVTLRTARAGQSYRGRVYLGGFTETDSDSSGNAVTAVGTSAVSFITSIGTTFSGNGLTLAVVSRPSERITVVTTKFHADGTTDVDTKVTNARSGTVTPVTSITARNNVWDTQRRRGAAGSGSTLLQESLATSYIGSEQLA